MEKGGGGQEAQSSRGYQGPTGGARGRWEPQGWKSSIIMATAFGKCAGMDLEGLGGSVTCGRACAGWAPLLGLLRGYSAPRADGARSNDCYTS